MVHNLISLTYLFAGVAQAPTVDSDIRFSLRATVVEAIEGGPVVIRLSLTNVSDVAIDVAPSSWRFAYLTIGSPSEWKQRNHMQPRLGFLADSYYVRPGEELIGIRFLHHEFDNIGAGRVRLKLSKLISSPGINRAILANLETKLDVEILPATREHLQALRCRLDQILDQPKCGPHDRKKVVSMIADTKHAALVPVAWRLLQSSPADYSDRSGEWRLFPFIEATSNDLADVNTRFVKLACNDSWAAKTDLFDHWRRSGSQLSREDLEQLTTTRSIWTRVLTYVVFPKKHETTLVNSLLVRLRDLHKPLSSDAFNRILQHLDDDSFDIREQASAELEAEGQRTEDQMRRCLGKSLPVEAERRLHAALEKLHEAKQPPDCVNTLAYLKFLDTPESQKVLEALAEGTADTWLRKESRSILDEKKKRSAPK